ncbi:F-box and WD-40 domain-containing protein CDC4 [Capronia epimyces CBS 606.96]|uniref:Mitochondrial division protein 1 n=1 Tax=Capronia epimyces CBS 606.96 TaxID=1182542 RepID=W9YAH5_9EURO|nr:F-box and WD-40 domain-containing protein CDC4 [Capronia epimyces CBS 606.96]EXJ89518.1 F-box and WD-40 domain-containing protein CDC4 [Capronia epimyces CBS 606.96]
MAIIDQETDCHFSASQDATHSSRTRHSMAQPRPKRLSTSIKTGVPLSILPSAPASPPTPAPSPTPYQRAPSWSSAGENEDAFLRDAREHFSNLHAAGRERYLAELLNMCDSQLLSFVHHFVSPRLKKDPFEHLPDELCLRVLSYIDDPQSLARASQVSHRWHKLLNDDMLWKIMCERHAWRKSSAASNDDVESLYLPQAAQGPYSYSTRSPKRNLDSSIVGPSSSAPNLTLSRQDHFSASPQSRKRQSQSHYSHFRHKYMIEAAWRKGGESIIKHITPDQGVVTSLHLTDKYIVVAMDNAKIHVFNTVGEHQKTLKGHVMGVWAMVPWDDILVSGGCDRDVRVWDMSTGKSLHTLRGHTSTVRCLKMSDANTAISGSRDTTLRIWDLTTGMCKNVLVGHQASVRCLAIHGDLVVSGSYDTTARIWSISEGRCLRTLTGHFSQIYAIAFDGNRIATGSLDTSVRIWDPKTGMCTAILQGHTSLVGQLQMQGDTLVTGGSDGSVRVWSLQTNTPIHRLAAHDNSVTSLQFDNHRIVSGGSDGRVKIWSLATGHLVRELSQPAEAVWRVAFEEEKAVIMASRSNRTVMEVWSFSPPEEPWERRSESPLSLPERIPAVEDDDERISFEEKIGDTDAAMSDV